MENHCTTVDQVFRLMALGLDPTTCDMSYEMNNDREYIIKYGQDKAITNNLFSFRFNYTLPCWSVGRLISLMPIVTIHSTTKKEYILHCLGNYTAWKSDLTEVCFDMMCVLLKKKMIQ